MTTAAHQSLKRVLGGLVEEKLLTAFFIFYKTARIIDRNNPTFQRQGQAFFEQLLAAGRVSGEVAIKIITGRYFVNENMVRFDDTGLSGAASVAREWKSLGVGGVAFSEGISQADVAAFFQFMAAAKPNSENLETLSERLKTQHLTCVRLLSVREKDAAYQLVSEETRRQFRAAARTTFFQAMTVAEKAMADTRDQKTINVSRTKRVIQSLIDHITRDESSLIELTSIKDFDDYTYAHSTNVCVYALTLGVRIGLDRARLSRLGFASLFHDVGKVRLSTDLIRKPGSYDENDWIQMQRHPLLGAKTILRNMKLDAHTARAARGAFEHHINRDYTGYPMLQYRKRPLNLFSRIISIVDTFDALSSGRIYLKQAVPPDETLRKMHFQMNTKFDTLLLKIFNDIIGIYPAGSLVLLTTEEIALVLTNNEADRSRPYVKVVGNRAGLTETPEWADLSQPENAHRKIVRMVDPRRYGLNIKDFVLQD